MRSIAAALMVLLLIAACGTNETDESREAPADLFGIISTAQKADYLTGYSDNEMQLADGPTISWHEQDEISVSGCDSEVYSDPPTIVGCPIYVWHNDDGSVRRILGASQLDPGTEGSVPIWTISAELYRRSGDLGTTSIGQFALGPDVTEAALMHACETPTWEIDVVDGRILNFVGWGRALFESPCGGNI